MPRLLARISTPVKAKIESAQRGRHAVHWTLPIAVELGVIAALGISMLAMQQFSHTE